MGPIQMNFPHCQKMNAEQSNLLNRSRQYVAQRANSKSVILSKNVYKQCF